MKIVFRKIARVKKRQAIKRAIAAAYTLKYGIINQTIDLFINASQEIQLTNNPKTSSVVDDDDQFLIESKSVNSRYPSFLR